MNVYEPRLTGNIQTFNSLYYTVRIIDELSFNLRQLQFMQ